MAPGGFSWTSSLKKMAWCQCQKSRNAAPDLPPWEQIELDFSGVVLLPPVPVKLSERKSSIASVISIITRSQGKMIGSLKANLPDAGLQGDDTSKLGGAATDKTAESNECAGRALQFLTEKDSSDPVSPAREETLDDFLKVDERTFVTTQTTQELATSQAVVESASAYFNHQASLLMFWFPVAYLFTLTPSLVRLFTEIATGRVHRTLRLIANLATISLGLQDVFIFGIVEWTIKRRVRKEFPDRL